MGKLKLELNNPQNVRDLLQEVYRLSDEQIIQAQNEINKLSVSTELEKEPMDARAKYAKAINDYLSMKDKAIAKKIDVAKILSEIYLKNGDVKGAIEDMGGMGDMSFNFDDIKQMVDNSLNEKEQTKKIELNLRNG